MVVLQKERAMKLGYAENMAKAIGYAEAKKYAIFKNRTSYKKKSTGVKLSNKKTNKKDIPTFDMLKEFRLPLSREGLPVIAGQPVTERDYDNYMYRFNEKELMAIENWARDLVENASERDLTTETRFFNYIWKPHRDDEITLIS